MWTWKAPEDDLAQEMMYDLEMNFNKIAPFAKKDTAKEFQDHAAKTQDTLVDAFENADKTPWSTLSRTLRLRRSNAKFSAC